MKLFARTRSIGAVVAALLSVVVYRADSAAAGTQADKSVAAASTTPRRPDGKPDLNGVWTQRFDGSDELPAQFGPDGSVNVVIGTATLGLYGAEQGGSVMRKGNRNKPMYKPEYWEKVRDLERNALKEDPEFKCQPWGVPRIGQPQQIVQQDNQVIFLYAGWPSVSNIYRVIPMNRPHNPDRVSQQTSRGDSVGRWDGDTLVVDTIGFGDETWLTSRLGYFHSTELHVIERLTRMGNQIKYEVTVEDPTVLLQPWVMNPGQMMTLNPSPDAMLPEDFPCSERDVQYTTIR